MAGHGSHQGARCCLPLSLPTPSPRPAPPAGDSSRSGNTGGHARAEPEAHPRGAIAVLQDALLEDCLPVRLSHLIGLVREADHHAERWAARDAAAIRAFETSAGQRAKQPSGGVGVVLQGQQVPGLLARMAQDQGAVSSFVIVDDLDSQCRPRAGEEDPTPHHPGLFTTVVRVATAPLDPAAAHRALRALQRARDRDCSAEHGAGRPCRHSPIRTRSPSAEAEALGEERPPVP